MPMGVRVIWFYLLQAFYDVRAFFGGTQVLLTDPRWKDELSLSLEDYGDF